MNAKRAHLIGWTLIGAVTALSFVMDHFRMLVKRLFVFFIADLRRLLIL